jgi:spore coat protein U-like protein
MTKPSIRLVVSMLLLAQASMANAAHSCTVAVGTLAFGAYSGAQINSSATMTIICTRTGFFDTLSVSYTAVLSTGVGTYAQRLLTKAPDTLNYNLYLATVPGVLNTNVWGDGTSGTITATGSVTWANLLDFQSKTTTHTVAGAIAAGAYPSAGSYQDTINVIVTYN